MQIRQDPISGLYCRSDGAILLPPTGYCYKKFRWTFGSRHPSGYLHVGYHGKYYKAHQIVCRAFHGLPPADKPEVDHINRIKDDNRLDNLRWASRKENTDNRDFVDKSIGAYGVRACDDPKAYRKIYDAARLTEKKAQGLTFRKGPDGKAGWFPRIRM